MYFQKPVQYKTNPNIKQNNICTRKSPSKSAVGLCIRLKYKAGHKQASSPSPCKNTGKNIAPKSSLKFLPKNLKDLEIIPKKEYLLSIITPYFLC